MNMQLLPDKYYHVFIESANNIKLFEGEETYVLFLRNLKEQLSDISQTLAYCLTPKSIDLVIKINSEESVFKFFNENGKFPNENETIKTIAELNERLKAQGFNVYDKQISKIILSVFGTLSQGLEGLKSNIFSKIKKRELNDQELLSSILTLHSLPIKNGLCENFLDWKFSSFKALISDLPTGLDRNEVLNKFKGREHFIIEHELEKAKLESLTPNEITHGKFTKSTI